MLITSKKIITGDGKTVLTGNGIYIKDGIIKKISTLADLKKLYPDEQVIDYGDAAILPGFIDTHTHIGAYDGMWDFTDYNEYRIGILGMQRTVECFQYGTTTIRDVGSPDKLMESLRTIADKGFAVFPRIFHSNQAISMTGGHCWRMSCVTEADGIEGLRFCIRDQIKKGADWIKVMTTHRIDLPEYSQEELDYASQESHRLGKKLAVHAALPIGLEMALKCKPDSIEHGTYLTVDQAKFMRDENIYWVPTVATLEYLVPSLMKSDTDSNAYYQIQIKDREYYARIVSVTRDNFLKLAETGVKIAAGTDFDTGYIPSAPVGMELKKMIDLGWDPLLAIQAGTFNGAELLGVSDTIGLIREGYTADIVVVNGDPQIDGSILEDVVVTYFGGKLVYTK